MSIGWGSDQVKGVTLKIDDHCVTNLYHNIPMPFTKLCFHIGFSLHVLARNICALNF